METKLMQHLSYAIGYRRSFNELNLENKVADCQKCIFDHHTFSELVLPNTRNCHTNNTRLTLN